MTNDRNNAEAKLETMLKSEAKTQTKPFIPSFAQGDINAPAVPAIEVTASVEEVAKKEVRPLPKNAVSYDIESNKFQFHKKITIAVRDSAEFKHANIGMPEIVKRKIDVLCTENDLSWVEYSNLMCMYIVEKGGLPDEIIKRYKKSIDN